MLQLIIGRLGICDADTAVMPSGTGFAAAREAQAEAQASRILDDARRRDKAVSAAEPFRPHL